MNTRYRPVAACFGLLVMSCGPPAAKGPETPPSAAPGSEAATVRVPVAASDEPLVTSEAEPIAGGANHGDRATKDVRASGLVVEDLVVGQGEPATVGRRVVVHYDGRLVDGTKFDSSVDRGRPFEIELGLNRVIKGWEEGLLGMRVGGRRRLTIPPELGYGARGARGKIPPNSTLIFEIELLELK